MNEQFALELHRAGDAIAVLQSLAFSPLTLYYDKFSERENASISVTILTREPEVSASICAQFAPGVGDRAPIHRAAPVDSNLGAVMAKTYRELFGVSEDTETDSE
jgi:hypothetical protein